MHAMVAFVAVACIGIGVSPLESARAGVSIAAMAYKIASSGIFNACSGTLR
jgi:hypothetical protein